jgi:hypothetical protein
MKRGVWLAAGACAAGGLLAAGCFAPAVVVASAGLSAFQTGTTAFIRGELEYADAVPMDVMHGAALDALRELRFRVVSERLGRTEAGIVAAEVGGRSIRVVLEAKSVLVTKVNIRVGVFGDQAVSRIIQQAIQAKIPKEFQVPEQLLDPDPEPDLHRRPYFPE